MCCNKNKYDHDKYLNMFMIYKVSTISRNMFLIQKIVLILILNVSDDVTLAWISGLMSYTVIYPKMFTLNEKKISFCFFVAGGITE